MNRSREEEEVLAEIKRALEPPKTIFIETQQQATTTATEGGTLSIERTSVETESSFDIDHDISFHSNTNDHIANIVSMDEPQPKQPQQQQVEDHHEERGVAAKNDLGSQKFFIGNLSGEEEDEASVQSRVSIFDEGTLSYHELMALVERLYGNLKQVDAALTKEKERRSAREKSMIKLAKELRNRKETITEYMEQIEELKEELRVARSERSLLEQRLDHHLEYDRVIMEQKLVEAQELYDKTCQDYDLRIQEMHRSHAEQCEHLCREVIQSNREAVRLQMKLSEVASAGGGRGPSLAAVDRAVFQYTTSSLDPPSYYLSPASPTKIGSMRNRSNKAFRRRVGILVFAVLVCTIIAVGQSSHNKMHFPIQWEDIGEKLRAMFDQSIVNNIFANLMTSLTTMTSEERQHTPIIPQKYSDILGQDLLEDSSAVKTTNACSVKESSKLTGDKHARIFNGSILQKLKARLQSVIRFFKKLVELIVAKKSQSGSHTIVME